MNAVTVNDSARALRLKQKAADLGALQLEAAAQPEPVAKPGFAVVRVGAAAVNPSDVKAALGLMPQAVWPRTPSRTRCARSCASIDTASCRLIGQSLKATSCNSSTKMPPSPTMIIGPNWGSRNDPTTSSRPAPHISSTR